jgi:hypothetical protein
MPTSSLVHASTCLATAVFLIHCSNSPSPAGDGAGSGGAKPATGGTTGGGSGGTGAKGGATTGGTGGTAGAGSTGGTAGANTTGGAGGTGGASTGGTGATGGTAGANTTGGAGGTGGSTGGTGGSTGGSGGASHAGAGGSGGTAGSAGTAGAAGMSGCATTDQNGKANWKPGDSTSTTSDYLRSCDIRLINNNWGAATLGCSASTSMYSVFVNQDGSFGWNFNRGNCDTQGTGQDPDFPEIEFGIHPFGIGSSLATSPNFSSTTLLPLQIKDIQTASVTINNLSIQLQQAGSWDITFEFWLSQRNPVTDPSPGVYSELMTFWGWQDGRYPEPPNGKGPTGNGAGDQVTSGAKTYKLEVQSDTWANGQWRYFQFRATDGPQMSFNGKVDVKPLLDYLVNTRGYSSDFWVSRFEVGSEIDDLTQGSVTVQSITFEVNGQTRSAGKQ